jgi:hypothetical protein
MLTSASGISNPIQPTNQRPSDWIVLAVDHLVCVQWGEITEDQRCPTSSQLRQSRLKLDVMRFLSHASQGSGRCRKI